MQQNRHDEAHTQEHTLKYGAEEHDLAQHVAWSPDCRHIALGGNTGAIEIWSVAPPRRELTYTGHSGERITQIAWSPDGSKIASTGPGGVVRVWSAATGEDLQAAQWHGVCSATWSPDGSHLALILVDGTLRLAGWGTPAHV